MVIDEARHASPAHPTMAHSTTHSLLARLLAIAVVLLLGVALAVITATLPELPPVVATHFGLDGHANGWMTSRRYALVIVAFTVGFPFVLWALVALVPRRFPRLAKIPDRDRWFAPAERERTLDRLDTFGRIHALGAVLLALGLHVLVIAKNVPASGTAELGAAVMLLVLAVLVLLATAIATKRAFRRTA